MEARTDNIEGNFKEIDQDLDLIAESLGGTRLDKVIYSPNDHVISYYSESVSATRKLKDKSSKEVNNFMRM